MDEMIAAIETARPTVKHTFTKNDRLLRRFEFLDISKNGKKLQNKNFIAYFRVSASQRSRIGITVTRKVGHAAARNRIKRIAREYFRLHWQMLKNPWDINLIAKTGASDISNQILFLSLENLFSRIAAIDHE